MHRPKLVALLFVALVTLSSVLVAGIISGKIVDISDDGKTITVETSKGSRKFDLGDSLPITLDNRTAAREKLEVGMRVSVFTDSSDRPSKLIARTESKSAATKSPAVRPMPKKERSSAAVSTSEGDWPSYLGPSRNNISGERGLLKRWPQSGPPLLWTARGLGSGYSSVSVADGMIYTMGNRGPNQSVLAMDFETGEGKWEVMAGPAFREGNGDGPRSTPTVAEGKVYGLGARGELVCADAKSGAVIWTKNIIQEFGGQAHGWGICESVLIDGEKLICTPGGPQATMAALDRENGRTLWTCAVPERDSAGYSSPIRIEVEGVAQYVQFTNRGTIGVRASDGKFLWRDNSAANGTANCSTPQFHNGMLFSASGYGHGGAMVRLSSARNETTAKFAYHTRDMKSHHGGFVIVDGYVYGSNEGVFVCLELRTGQVKWQSRSPGKGSLTCVDGMLIVRNESGAVTLVQASPAGYRELGRFDQAERSGSNAWAYPVVSHGRLFLRDMDNLLCYDLREK